MQRSFSKAEDARWAAGSLAPRGQHASEKRCLCFPGLGPVGCLETSRGQGRPAHCGDCPSRILEKQVFCAGLARRAGQQPLRLSAWLLGNFTNWLLLAREVGGCGKWNIPLGRRFRSGLAVGDFWVICPLRNRSSVFTADLGVVSGSKHLVSVCSVPGLC